MKLLYLGCHEVLEFDELRMFSEIEWLEVFGPGAYTNPEGIGGRPAIPTLNYRPEWLDAWSRVPVRHELPPPLSDQKANLTPELLEHFDAVMIMHVPGWLTNNWDTLKQWGGEIYWRDIGQTQYEQEAMLGRYVREGLKVIRYSPKSRQIQNYAGEHALIRFGKYPEDFLPWVGDRRNVITIAQSMKDREPACGYNIFTEATRPFNRKLFGKANESSGALWAGEVSYQRLLEELSWNRCYFYTGTYPAPYTLNFMEALFSGCPIVAIGKGLARFEHYEVAEIMDAVADDLTADTTSELQELCRATLGDTDEALKIRSDGQREVANELFGADTIKKQWAEVFGL